MRHMSIGHNKILVVRHDRLGDFMLAWPALATLKGALPECEVHALVNPYTAEMARLCPSINEVVPDPGAGAGIARQLEFAATLRRQRYDAVVTLYSTLRIAWVLAVARIPYRLAPATKIAQVFYHKRLRQRRSQSNKPESEYNRDLIIRYLRDAGTARIGDPGPPYLQFDLAGTEQLRREFCAARQIPPTSKLIFIHPGSGGSANNLSPEQYAELGRRLADGSGRHIVVSAGPAELEQATRVADGLGGVSRSTYHSTAGLERFARHIAFADLFVSGSTGPLHIAGALDCNTAAFYTRRQSATALRWQTINSPARRLAFSPPDGAEPEDMSSIDIAGAAGEITRRFLSD